jgi:type IV secretion system protein VirD4
MKKNKLFEVNGQSILVGQYKKKLLAFNGELHVFLAALTGSGKGVGFVIPNLLNWDGSTIVLDIKREGYDITAKYREDVLKNKVFIFQPLENETDCFNPFDYIAEGDRRIDDIQTIADILIEINDPYFDPMAQHLFGGLVLLVLEHGDFLGYTKSIGQIYSLLGTDIELSKYLSQVIEKIEITGTTLSPKCRQYLASYINEPEKARGSIRSSLVSHLSLWANPLIDRSTSRSSFDFRKFRITRNSLYLVCSPRELDRLNKVFRLVIELFIATNAKPGERIGFKNFEIPVLLMLDEFISLGKMTKLVHALSYIRGWGIKIATVIQSPNQLHSLYGAEAAEAYEENHRASIMFRPNRMSNKRVEQMASAIGHITAKSKSKSRPLFLTSGSRSISESETQGFLVTPDQIRAMPDNKSFVMVDGMRPIYTEKILYYKLKYFKKRLLGTRPLPESIKKRKEIESGTGKTPIFIKQKKLNFNAISSKINDISIPEGKLSETDINNISDKFCDVFLGFIENQNI